MMCEGCTNEQHFLCGMQTWCECACDGSIDWGVNEIDPDTGLTCEEAGDDEEAL